MPEIHSSTEPRLTTLSSLQRSFDYPGSTMNNTPSAVFPAPNPGPVPHNSRAHPYRPIQLTDLASSSSSSTTTTPPCNPTPHPVLQHRDSLTLLTRHAHGTRTISTIKAATHSLKHSDNAHAATPHNKQAQQHHSPLSFKKRYERGRQSLANTSAGAEFVLMWDLLSRFKSVIFKAIDRRARKNASKARLHHQQQQQQQYRQTLVPGRHDETKLFEARPAAASTVTPTPIYEAHRKHHSKPAPEEFERAYAVIKNQPQPPSPPALPALRRKPVPGTGLKFASQRAIEGTELPRSLRRSHHIALEDIATPRSVARPSDKAASRLTRLSDFLNATRPARPESNILTGSDKQSRPCDICGAVSSAASNSAGFSRQRLWLCGGCQTSDGAAGELPPLSPKQIGRLRRQGTRARVEWDLSLGRDVVWNCEHCHASFSSRLPAQGQECICPLCRRSIAAHPRQVSRPSSKGSKGNKVSSKPSTLDRRVGERSRFSCAKRTSHGLEVIDDEDLMGLASRSSVSGRSEYDDIPVEEDSPVSPLGQGRFDNFESEVHTASRTRPPMTEMIRSSLASRPATEWRDNKPIPGINASQSYQEGPSVHLKYEYLSLTTSPSAATTAMDLSLPLTPQAPQAPQPAENFFSKSKSRKHKEAEYEKLRRIKYAASSSYPEDEVEKVCLSDRPLHAMPSVHFGIHGRVHDVRRESFYPMTPDVDVEQQTQEGPQLPVLSEADRKTGLWPKERRSSFYSFYRPILERVDGDSRHTVAKE